MSMQISLSLFFVVVFCVLHRLNNKKWPSLFPVLLAYMGVSAAAASGLGIWFQGQFYYIPWFMVLIYGTFMVIVPIILALQLWWLSNELRQSIQKDKS